MRTIAMILWLALALAACGDDSPPPGPDAATATIPRDPPPSCPITACHPDAAP